MFRPSDSTAKWVSEPQINAEHWPSCGQGTRVGLHNKAREVPVCGVFDHRDRGRLGWQRPGPPQRHVADLGQPQLTVGQYLEPGVGGEPDGLPMVLAGPEPGWGNLRSFALA